MCNPAVDQLEAQRVFQTFLTGLREGLEAALVVSILLTFLVRGDHRDRIPALWAGVGVAIAVSFGFGAVLHFTSANMSFEAQEAFGGILSIVAVGFVTWMVFWMKRASRTIKGDLTHKMEAALKLGASGVFLAALLAVGREGLETALFLYPTLQAQGSGIGPALGAVLGIATAVGIGFLLYRGAVNLNLATFFKVTGAGLIVIAAGVLAYGVHDLQEAAILPGLNTLAWDINGWDITSWYGTLLKGIFNVGPQMTVLEVITYVAYLVPTMVLFLRPLPASDTGSTSSAPGEHTATAAPTLTPPTTVPAGGHS
ncbi:Iron permease FTR1 [Candidatus Microthrix parvicella RN1]|jgi:high-affinity iron transporter|uniref:Iron permease FTR1 n=1 Tax=Candidatus Neomicrothrix parvicella RN1 TaxID=1229780 RepID=R4Z0K1_9ACTN|nr:Iron permease FTR1 [Candidatus Microthrix parvicella RN1]